MVLVFGRWRHYLHALTRQPGRGTMAVFRKTPTESSCIFGGFKRRLSLNGLLLVLNLSLTTVNSYGPYQGCYMDDASARTMDVTTVYRDRYRMTIERCEHHCLRNTTYTFLGLQVVCWCGEDYDRYGAVPTGNCSYICSGNASQKCGSASRNSIYAVCPSRHWGKKCDKECHCDGPDVCNRQNGTCNSTCRPGWSGPSCSHPDCSSQNGDCEHVCEQNDTSFWCRCNGAGYDLDPDGRGCTDVDECKQNRCSAGEEFCENTIGGYTCSCPDGYQIAEKSLHQCIDSDECLLDNGDCEHVCTNTVGSFHCSCRPPYVLTNQHQCESMCEKAFQLKFSKTRDLASACPTHETLQNVTLRYAKSLACNISGDVIATVNGVFLIKRCSTEDLLLRHEGGWDIYRRGTISSSEHEEQTVTPPESEAELGVSELIIIGIVVLCVAIALIAVAVVLIARRRRQQEEPVTECLASVGSDTPPAPPDAIVYDDTVMEENTYEDLIESEPCSATPEENIYDV